MKLEHRSFLPALLSVLAALANGPAVAQGKVWVVDDSGGPGVAFTTIQAAVNAAAEGDTLLVKDGTYDEFVTISAKSLAVIAEVGASVQVLRTVYVQSLGASQWSLVRGIDVPMTATSFFGEAMRVGGNSGPTWIEDGAFEGAHNFGGAASGVLLSGASCAMIARCQIRGGTGISSKTSDAKSGGPGLFVISSSAYAYDSALRGEDAVTPSSVAVFASPAPGGSGATIDTSLLFASGSDLIGGKGADGVGTGTFCNAGGDGGNGLTVYGASSQGLLHDAGLLPGAGGSSAGTCQGGQPGQPTFFFAGSASTLPGTSRSLEVASPVREGQAVSAQASGAPGELVFLGVASSQSVAQLVLPWNGAVHLGPGFTLLFAGVVPASGTLAIGATAGTLAPGVESAVIYLQAGFAAPATGSVALGAPSALVVLDSAF